MKATTILLMGFTAILTSCASVSSYMTAPDEAYVHVQGTGFGIPDVATTSFSACAKTTVKHGYRYFILTGLTDTTTTQQMYIPGSASTFTTSRAHVNVYGYGDTAWGNGYGSSNSNTIINPPYAQTIYKPGVVLTIKMSNDSDSLIPFAYQFPNGTVARPKDAAFLVKSLPHSG